MLGLCIRYFNPNYGGMLQGYATMEILKKRNIEFELIRYEKEKNLQFVISSIPRLFNPILRYEKRLILSKKISSKLHPEFSRNEKIRRNQFRKFEQQYFAQKEHVYIGYDELEKGTERYDVFITGSDQIWSPSGLESNFYNLMFVPDAIRKISLASSFGVGAIPKNQIDRTREYLNRIPFISMRENQGAQIVEELTGKKVPVVVDPVCMLTGGEWTALASKGEFCKEDYLFAYLMGDNPKYREQVTTFAKEQGLKVIALRHANQYVKADETFGDYCYYDIDPFDFLALICNAKMVCTDSYHGSLFALIMHKELAIFNRYNGGEAYSKNSRIDTLCKNYFIQKRRFSSENNLNKIFSERIDYEKVDCLMEEGRNKFDKYLDNALTEEL